MLSRAKQILLVFIILLCLTLVACSPGSSVKTDNGEKITITDFVGSSVTVDKEPQRVVSLAPSTTELLYALGLGDSMVGVTDYDDYPPEVENVPKVGGVKGPNIEAIVQQKPDIIFASRLSGKEQMQALQQQLDIPVVVLEAQDIEQIYQAVKIIGRLFNIEDKGTSLINDMQNHIQAVQQEVQHLPPVEVFYLVDINGTWTAGKGTFIDEIITMAGGHNVAGDVQGWTQYSLEKLVFKNPAVLVTAPHAGDVSVLKNTAGYKDIRAVKENKIYVISDDNLISRASNRIVYGLEEMALYLHPEAFK